MCSTSVRRAPSDLSVCQITRQNQDAQASPPTQASPTRGGSLSQRHPLAGVASPQQYMHGSPGDRTRCLPTLPIGSVELPLRFRRRPCRRRRSAAAMTERSSFSKALHLEGTLFCDTRFPLPLLSIANNGDTSGPPFLDKTSRTRKHITETKSYAGTTTKPPPKFTVDNSSRRSASVSSLSSASPDRALPPIPPLSGSSSSRTSCSRRQRITKTSGT